MRHHPLLEGMNSQQGAAITAGDGPVLVLAGPGSGKTAVLTRRIAWLIREQRAPHHRIMAVTFTNKAADEMRSRLEHMLDGNLDGMQIGTFHAFCKHILRQHGELLGYGPGWKILPTTQQSGIIRRILERIAVDAKLVSPWKIRKAVSLAKNNLILPEDYCPTDEFNEIVRRVYHLYEQELLSENVLDVDDLLLKLALLLRDFARVREKYQHEFEHLLIDEFQDTNLVQYEIVKLLAPPRHHVFVVGDEDQSIYAFRGANHRNLQRLRNDFPELTQFLLEENYRSTQVILDAAKAVIDHNDNRTPKRLHTDNGAGMRIQVYEAASQRGEAVFVQQQIQRLRASDGAKFGDFAVMYRLNKQSFPLRNVLHRHHVPFRVVNTIDFHQRKEVRDLMALLHLAHESNGGVFLKRIPNVKKCGISRAAMDGFVNWLENDRLTVSQAIAQLDQTNGSGLTSRQRRAFAAFSAMLRDWQGMAQRGNLVTLFDRIIQQTEFDAHLERSCREDWELAERRKSVSELRGIAKAAMAASRPFRKFVALVDAEIIDDDPNKVALTTLHSAKGLEFPVVFIIGLNQDILPHVHDIEGPNDLAEERRLFYVGMTRAERQLYLTYARHKGLGDELLAPSEFLAELPDRLIDLH